MGTEGDPVLRGIRPSGMEIWAATRLHPVETGRPWEHASCDAYLVEQAFVDAVQLVLGDTDANEVWEDPSVAVV